MDAAHHALYGFPLLSVDLYFVFRGAAHALALSTVYVKYVHIKRTVHLNYNKTNVLTYI